MSGEFLFAIGIIVGIIVDVIARWFYDWYRRPIIAFVEGSELNIWQVESGLVVYPPGTDIRTRTPDKLPGKVYRVKIHNIGRSAAYNVRGTVELRRPDTSSEQRICWYEGNVASITINSKDHSYLDVYGVPGVEAPEAYNGAIITPMEHGWSSGVLAYKLMGDEAWRLRVTAVNCKPLSLEFTIDPENDCRLAEVCLIDSKRINLIGRIRHSIMNLGHRSREMPGAPQHSVLSHDEKIDEILQIAKQQKKSASFLSHYGVGLAFLGIGATVAYYSASAGYWIMGTGAGWLLFTVLQYWVISRKTAAEGGTVGREGANTPQESNGRYRLERIARSYLLSQAPVYVLVGFLLMRLEWWGWTALAIVALVWAFCLCCLVILHNRCTTKAVLKLVGSEYEAISFQASLLVFGVALIFNIVDMAKDVAEGKVANIGYFYVFYIVGLVVLFSPVIYMGCRTLRGLHQKSRGRYN